MQLPCAVFIEVVCCSTEVSLVQIMLVSFADIGAQIPAAASQVCDHLHTCDTAGNVC